MRDIGIVIAVICVSSVSCSIVGSLAPQNSSKRILSMVLGVFIVCTLISPIKNTINGFKLDINEAKPYQSEISTSDEIFTQNVLEEAENNLEKLLGKLLADNNINCKSTKIILKSDDKTGIYIESIRIYLYKTEDVMKTKRIVKAKFEVTPEIYGYRNENQ